MIKMFAKTFWTPYTQYKDKIGQSFEVIGKKDPSTYDYDEVGDMWLIRLEDGSEIEAYPEEIIEEYQRNSGRKDI